MNHQHRDILNSAEFCEAKVDAAYTRLVVIVRAWGVVVIEDNSGHVARGHTVFLDRSNTLRLLDGDKVTSWPEVSQVTITAN